MGAVHFYEPAVCFFIYLVQANRMTKAAGFSCKEADKSGFEQTTGMLFLSKSENEINKRKRDKKYCVLNIYMLLYNWNR